MSRDAIDDLIKIRCGSSVDLGLIYVGIFICNGESQFVQVAIRCILLNACQPMVLIISSELSIW